MEEQQVKPSDLPPTTSDNQDSAATPPVTTTVDPVRPAASADSSSQVAAADPAAVSAPTAAPAKDAAGREAPASMFSTSGLSSWAKNLKIPQPSSGQESPTGKNTFSRLTSGLGLHLSPKAAQQDEIAEGSVSPTTGQPGVFGSLTKGIVDSSKNDVKAVQVKARHMVSQNKRRYQEGGFDLDEKLGEDAAHQRHLVPVSMNTAGTRGRDPTDDPSSQYFVDDAHPYAAAAATALTSHRTKSKWSNLSSVPIPSPLPASAATAVLLRLRRRPHTALRFHAFALRRLLPSYSPPPLVFSASAAHVAAASRLRDAALAVLASASRHYSPAEIFNALAATYRRFASAPFVFDLLLLAYLRSRRDALAAASVARRILAAGARPLPSTAAALLRSLPSAAAALDMYHQIYTHSSPQRNHLLLPIVHTFNSLLLAFYREGKCDKFKIVLQEMGKYSCKHNVYTYNILMAGYCDCKDVEKARGLWDEMIHEGIQPDVTAYNTMIGGYCRVGEVGMAEEMFKDMEMGGIDPSATTFEWLVRGHCMAGDAEVAMLVRADMRRRGFGLAPEVVEELLDGLCQNGRVEDGLGVLRVELRREEFVPTQRSYEVLIKGFCAEGEVEVAIRLQAEMAGKGFNASSEMYHAFIHAYEKSEDYEMVEKLRKEMAVMCT